MDLFYVIVLSVAVAILIILLTFVGIGLRKHGGFGTSKGGAWPPIESSCPDYWTIDPADPKSCVIPSIDQSNPNIVPRNTGSIYKDNIIDSGFSSVTKGYDGSNMRIDFTDPYYTACNKKSWAKKWGVYWDGYTNYNGCK